MKTTIYIHIVAAVQLTHSKGTEELKCTSHIYVVHIGVEVPRKFQVFCFVDSRILPIVCGIKP